MSDYGAVKRQSIVEFPHFESIECGGSSARMRKPNSPSLPTNVSPRTERRVSFPLKTAIWAIALLFMRCIASAYAAESVSLAWDANVETNIAGYRLYYGALSGHYTQMLDVGNVTEATISNLTAGFTYFFAVTAYDSAGFESLPSNETSLTIAPGRLPVTIGSMQRLSDGSFQFTLKPEAGLAGFLNGIDIEVSSDLSTWTVLTHLVSLTETVLFIDPDAVFSDRRFYRVTAN